ncbi:hypothetical protein BC830DRAFT_1094183 [Chytriomyces sp. MP71]|nr:hypothetical protein BC830DRAFT_1094183 [Chytriomyces sp. MP71]
MLSERCRILIRVYCQIYRNARGILGLPSWTALCSLCWNGWGREMTGTCPLSPTLTMQLGICRQTNHVVCGWFCLLAGVCGGIWVQPRAQKAKSRSTKTVCSWIRTFWAERRSPSNIYKSTGP